jgi:hypothetical protein
MRVACNCTNYAKIMEDWLGNAVLVGNYMFLFAFNQ